MIVDLNKTYSFLNLKVALINAKHDLNDEIAKLFRDICCNSNCSLVSSNVSTLDCKFTFIHMDSQESYTLTIKHETCYECHVKKVDSSIFESPVSSVLCPSEDNLVEYLFSLLRTDKIISE